MTPLAVLATGMITGVGLDAPSSCAAMRCVVDRFEETRFMDQGGKWIVGSEVPLVPRSRGREKIVRMAAAVISECFAAVQDVAASQVPIFLCLAESDRPGRIGGLDPSLLRDVAQQIGVRFHPASEVIANGRIGGAEAVCRAEKLIGQGSRHCLVAGVDSYLVGPTLASFEVKNRLLTSKNSDGFIPGEAGAAVLFGPAGAENQGSFQCLGVGFGTEKATVESDEPLRGDGLAQAFRAVLDAAGCSFEKVDYRITDANGEQYHFKEATLAMSRTMRVLKTKFDIWHPADCIGEVGAAIVPCVIGVARAAALKSYAPGQGALCHFSNDDGGRAAMVLRLCENGVNDGK